MNWRCVLFGHDSTHRYPFADETPNPPLECLRCPWMGGKESRREVWRWWWSCRIRRLRGWWFCHDCGLRFGRHDDAVEHLPF